MAANPQFIDTPVNRFLDRLSGVKKIRPDRWQARCPAHGDRSPSLAITETPEGTVLIKCWAGCSADSIVGAAGLELKDLFPQRFDYQSTNKGKPPRYSAQEVVKTVTTEAAILALGFRALINEIGLSDADHARVEVAISAIENCREVVS